MSLLTMLKSDPKVYNASNTHRLTVLPNSPAEKAGIKAGQNHIGQQYND